MGRPIRNAAFTTRFDANLRASGMRRSDAPQVSSKTSRPQLRRRSSQPERSRVPLGLACAYAGEVEATAFGPLGPNAPAPSLAP